LGISPTKTEIYLSQKETERERERKKVLCEKQSLAQDFLLFDTMNRQGNDT
jgi:hypothetical protein